MAEQIQFAQALLVNPVLQPTYYVCDLLPNYVQLVNLFLVEKPKTGKPKTIYIILDMSYKYQIQQSTGCSITLLCSYITLQKV